MAYITSPGFAGIDLTEVSSGAVVPVGTEVMGSDGNTWKYVQFKNAALSGQTHLINDAGEAYAYTSTANAGAVPSQVGFAQHDATDEYHTWLVVKGVNFLGQADSGATSADTKAYTGTNQSRFTGLSAGKLISGLRANAAGAGETDISCSNAGYAELNTQD